MPGHGHPPSRSQPSPAVLVTLRVVFVLLALCTCGLLTWAAPLRIAVLRKRAVDWAVFAAVLVLGIGILVFAGVYGSPPAKDGEEAQLNTADVVCLLLLFALSAGVTTYYLIADIQHFRRRGPQPTHAWGAVAPPGPQGSGHPMPSGPPDRPTYPYPAAQQQPPAPRLHQVRAELDELSELLRKDRTQDGDGGRPR